MAKQEEGSSRPAATRLGERIPPSPWSVRSAPLMRAMLAPFVHSCA